MKKISCAFTGHRPQNLPFRFNELDERCVALKRVLREQIEQAITERGITHFISGMALGVDTYAAEIVLELKKKVPDIMLECAIPCISQPNHWNETQRDRYYSILTRCDQDTILQKEYTGDCMQKRNCYMVDNADLLIAVWDGSRSGTGKTVEYAQQKGLTILIIHPVSLRTEYL